ncbi:hypothetical protein F5148DRAFT_990644, partial [Russula earlei]
HELSDTDWESFTLVTSWLTSIQAATIKMSATKIPMLSMMHAIFCGLQDDIENILCDLPNSVLTRIKLSLTDVHLVTC